MSTQKQSLPSFASILSVLSIVFYCVGFMRVELELKEQKKRINTLESAAETKPSSFVPDLIKLTKNVQEFEPIKFHRNKRQADSVRNTTEAKSTADTIAIMKINKLLSDLKPHLCHTKGDTCLLGPTGPPGPRGEKGSRGRRGQKGRTGNKGDRGIQGSPGKSGKEGIVGPVGLKGEVGLKGQKGDVGPQGMPGVKGEPGESISAPVVAVSPKKLTVNEGGSALFQCSVSGNPEPAIVWSKVDKQSTISQSAVSKRKLHLKNVAGRDSGIYICSAANILGQAQASVQLVVNVLPTVITPTPTEFVCEAVADVAFIVDSSGSVGNRNWPKMLQFLKDMVKAFNVGPDKTHIGVVAYSTGAKVEFKFDTLKGSAVTEMGYYGIIDRIRFQRGYTFIDKALILANRELFTTSSGMRPELPQIAIVITDGRQTTDRGAYTELTVASRALKNKNVQVYSLGIGMNIDQQQLIDIASSSSKVFTTASFAELTPVAQTIVQNSCPVLPTVITPAPTDGLAASNILGSLDNKYLDKLNSYLDPVLLNSSRGRFVRCWHAKTNGWTASSFHSNCDGKGPTVTIVQVGSYIFGGYTDKSWSSPSSCPYVSSSKSFLFSLYNINGYAPVKLKIKSSHYSLAILTCSGYGPTFGGGHDLKISNNATSNQQSYTNCGFSYPLPPGYSASGSSCRFYAGGQGYKFTPSDIEVFYEATT